MGASLAEASKHRPQRCEVVRQLELGLSERQALKLMGMSPSTLRHRLCGDGNGALRERLKELADALIGCPSSSTFVLSRQGCEQCSVAAWPLVNEGGAHALIGRAHSKHAPTKSQEMFRPLSIIFAAGVALFGATAAHAGTHWSVGINLPIPGIVVTNVGSYGSEPQPVYYAPAPVVRYAPVPIYEAPPDYVAPQLV